MRVKQLAEAPGGAVYADALRELFDLDAASGNAASVSAVTVSAVTGGAVPGAVDVRPDVERPAAVRRGGAA